MRPTLALAVILALTGGIALAQQSPDEAIAARQQGMKVIAGNMKVLGDMASGKAAFDAAAAGEAGAKLVEEAEALPALFQTNAVSADSKASPKIWTDHAGFLEHAKALETGAKGIDASSLDTLKATIGGAGGTCRACHTDYRS